MNDEEVESFTRFWTAIMGRIPPEGYGHIRERVEPKEISYNRYSDALLSWGVPIERRISDAVIGLESLFLVQADELSYRLRLLVAKLLAVFGFDVYEVKETVGLAYEVRSSFLHGSNVSGKTLRKIDAKHDGLDKLLLKLLDYLRCSIAILALTGIKKPELINRIEASLLDELAWQELKELLEDARPLVSPTS